MSGCRNAAFRSILTSSKYSVLITLGELNYSGPESPFTYLPPFSSNLPALTYQISYV